MRRYTFIFFLMLYIRLRKRSLWGFVFIFFLATRQRVKNHSNALLSISFPAIIFTTAVIMFKVLRFSLLFCHKVDQERGSLWELSCPLSQPPDRCLKINLIEFVAYIKFLLVIIIDVIAIILMEFVTVWWAGNQY